MTAPTETLTPHERASDVQEALEKALAPGGELHLALDDLIGRAEVIALDAANAPIGDEGPPAGWVVSDDLRNRVGWEIAEDLFKVALRYATAPPVSAR